MEARTVWKVLEETAAAHPEKPAFQQPLGGGKYRTWNWSEVRDTVREAAVGLHCIGVRKGSIVALQCETRAEFYIADLAVISAGAISGALYTSLPFADQAATLRASEANVAFVENRKVARALEGAGGAPHGMQWILLADDEGEGTLTLSHLCEIGRGRLAEDPSSFDRILAQYDPTADAILYMTSGATGEPKMGLVTHRALVANIDMAPAVLTLTPEDSTIAFLPSAHIAQRVVVELLPVRQGCCVWFSEGLSKLPHEIRAIRPTFFLAPPRLWERVFSTISAEIRKRPAPVRRLFYFGLGLGAKAARLKQEGKRVPPAMKAALRGFDRAMFSKIRERLGGRIRVPASGSAPLSKDLAEFYAAIGMPLIEGYGLTEGGVATLNPLDRPKPGSIGTLLPGVEARIEEDGELMLRSPCLFSGYFKDPEATSRVLRDGWLATGDIAETDADGYYYITGRKKDLIVSSNGKKIYPARIEGLFRCEPSINHVLLIGDRMPYVTALFTIQGNTGDANRAVERAVKHVNKQLAPFEQIRKFKILDRDFSVDTGELTPTMKVRRNRVLENHRALVSEMYMGRDIE